MRKVLLPLIVALLMTQLAWAQCANGARGVQGVQSQRRLVAARTNVVLRDRDGIVANRVVVPGNRLVVRDDPVVALRSRIFVDPLAPLPLRTVGFTPRFIVAPPIASPGLIVLRRRTLPERILSAVFSPF